MPFCGGRAWRGARVAHLTYFSLSSCCLPAMPPPPMRKPLADLRADVCFPTLFVLDPSLCMLYLPERLPVPRQGPCADYSARVPPPPCPRHVQGPGTRDHAYICIHTPVLKQREFADGQHVCLLESSGFLEEKLRCARFKKSRRVFDKLCTFHAPV